MRADRKVWPQMITVHWLNQPTDIMSLYKRAISINPCDRTFVVFRGAKVHQTNLIVCRVSSCLLLLLDTLQ